MRTNARAESEQAIAKLRELGFIASFVAILDNGFLFFYTEKGERFAQTVATEAKEVGVSAEAYMDIYDKFKLQGEGGSDGEGVGDPPA
jgi:hypothetical protein